MADSASSRPLSPHLSLWRWHVTMLGSILHRVTGVGLYGLFLLACGWLATIALGQDAFDQVTAITPRWLVDGLLYLAAAAVGYHAANGVRHLVLDAGAGFKLSSANFSAWLCLLAGLAAPGALWLVLHGGGIG